MTGTTRHHDGMMYLCRMRKYISMSLHVTIHTFLIYMCMDRWDSMD